MSLFIRLSDSDLCFARYEAGTPTDFDFATFHLAPQASLTLNLRGAMQQVGLLQHDFDRVEVLDMHYFSAGRQRIENKVLLPVSAESFGTPENANKPYLFEPDPNKIYNTILPLYIISVMQESFMQNAASEQAARVMAMQAANDNAGKLLESLKLEFNKLRQQSITTELLDILGGQVDK